MLEDTFFDTFLESSHVYHISSVTLMFSSLVNIYSVAAIVVERLLPLKSLSFRACCNSSCVMQKRQSVENSSFSYEKCHDKKRRDKGYMMLSLMFMAIIICLIPVIRGRKLLNRELSMSLYLGRFCLFIVNPI